MQMKCKHMEKVLEPLVIREMQIEVTKRSHFISVTMAII